MESSPEVNSSTRKYVYIDNLPKLNSSELYLPRPVASPYSNLKSSLNNDHVNNNRNISNNDYRSSYTNKSSNCNPNVYSSKYLSSNNDIYSSESQNNSFYGGPLSGIKDEYFLSQQYDNRMSFHSSGNYFKTIY